MQITIRQAKFTCSRNSASCGLLSQTLRLQLDWVELFRHMAKAKGAAHKILAIHSCPQLGKELLT